MLEAISEYHTEKIGGDINFRSDYDSSKTAIMTKAALFGLSWLGDGATIKKMPLINMLVMSGDKPPAVISICDCTDHMVEDGKKDAKFIMNKKQNKGR